MIMLITHQSELREQISKSLRESGQTVAIPPHRQDMLTTLKDTNPDLIVLDLYVSDPSGAEDWKMLRDHGFQGGIIILAGPSIMSVLKGMHHGGIVCILQVPTMINGQFHLGELLSTVHSLMEQDKINKAVNATHQYCPCQGTGLRFINRILTLPSENAPLYRDNHFP